MRVEKGRGGRHPEELAALREADRVIAISQFRHTGKLRANILHLRAPTGEGKATGEGPTEEAKVEEGEEFHRYVTRESR
jgi:hypothetical protein